MRGQQYSYICALLLFLAAPAHADIRQTFNTNELSHDFALPCGQQAALRHQNIPSPYFSGRPSEFQNDSESLALYSPHLTARQRQTAEKIFASVPAHVLPMAYRGGAVYVFTRRSIVEAVPALAVEDNWFQDFGLYMAVERRLYIPFEKGEGVVKKSDGTFAARRFIPSQREPFRIVNHESGHMIDSLLGHYSLNSTGDDGDPRLSNRADYLAALNADLSRLISKERPLSAREIERLGYYMPREFEGINLGGMQPSLQRARREIFAELWAEVQGYDSNKISRAYPSAFKIVKHFDDFLKAQYAVAPIQCALQP